MKKYFVFHFLFVIACIAFRQNPACANGAKLYSEADSVYAKAEYEQAQALYQKAGLILEAEGSLDSAARSIYFGAKCDWQRGDLKALKVYYQDILYPAMARIKTPLATAYINQANADIAFKEYDLEKCDKYLEKAFHWYTIAGKLYFDEAISNRSFLAVGYLGLGKDLDSALALAQYAVDLANRYHQPCSKPIAYANLTLGSVLYVKEDMAASLEAYQLAHQIFSEILPPQHPHIVASNTALAEMHAEMNHPVQALYFSKVAIDNAQHQDRFQQGAAYFRYGKVLSELDLQLQAKYWIGKAREIFRNAPTEHKMQESLVLNASINIFSALDDTLAMSALLDTLLRINHNFDGFTNSGDVNVYITIAQVRLFEGKLEESLEAYLNALAIARIQLNEIPYNFRDIYQHVGYNHLLGRRLDSAQFYYCLAEPYLVEEGQESLSWNIDFHLLGIGISTELRDFESAADKLERVLAGFASTAKQDKIPPLLIEVVESAQRLYKLEPSARNRELFLRSVSFTDRLLSANYALLAAERWTPAFLESLRGIYSDAAFAASETCAASSAISKSIDKSTDWCKLSIRYADLPRALALRRRGAEISAGLLAGIPDSLIERGQYLQRQQAALLHAEMDSTRRSSALAELQNAVAEHETELSFHHPQYFASVLSPLELDVDALARQAMREQVAYISFLIDSARNRALVCLIDGQHPPRLHIVEHGDEQVRLIAAYNAELAGRHNDRLPQLAHALYTHYLLPVLPKGSEIKGLTIASDSQLAGMAFAALLTDFPKPISPMREWPWLGLKYRISYVDALASAQHAATGANHNSSLEDGLRIACVTPGFDGRSSQPVTLAAGLGATGELLRTPWTLALGKLLGERYGAEVLAGESATEQAFVEAFAKASIVHLGTHAFLNESDPLRSYFALTPQSAEHDNDGRLYAYEIYGLPTQARLAVLPACSSGSGKFQSGEGTLSLATAFRNSGCPTVVQTFWSIDDQQTNALLEPFYTELAKGQPVAGALANAQLSYLNSASESLQHPYYWASLAVVGPSTSFGESSSERSQTLIVIGIIFLATLGFLALVLSKQTPGALSKA